MIFQMYLLGPLLSILRTRGATISAGSFFPVNKHHSIDRRVAASAHKTVLASKARVARRLKDKISPDS